MEEAIILQILMRHKTGLYSTSDALGRILSLLDENREVVSDDSRSESSDLHDVRKWNATTVNDAGSEPSVESALGKRIDSESLRYINAEEAERIYGKRMKEFVKKWVEKQTKES